MYHLKEQMRPNCERAISVTSRETHMEVASWDKTHSESGRNFQKCISPSAATAGASLLPRGWGGRGPKRGRRQAGVDQGEHCGVGHANTAAASGSGKGSEVRASRGPAHLIS